jgi:hypothetical protein
MACSNPLKETRVCRMRISLSLPLLGLNWGSTLNPYLATPINQVLQVRYSQCRNNGKIELAFDNYLFTPGELMRETINRLTQVYNRLTGKTENGICLHVDVTGKDYVPLVSLYSSSTLSMIYLMLREVLGGKPGENDIMDVANYIWSKEKPGIKMLYEALILSAMKHKPVLYRGYDEQILLEEFSLDKIVDGRQILLGDISTEYMDPQLSSALVKLEGTSIISAVNRIASAMSYTKFEAGILRNFFKVDNSLAYIVYDLPVPRENCKYIQSIDGYLEEICFEGS